MLQPEGFMEGIVTTRPHLWKAGEVRVNVQSEGGGVRVQLQDETGRLFDGFSTAHCDPISVDALDHAVTWGSAGSDVRALEGKMVALRFTIMPKDRLYSYTLKPQAH